MGAYIQGALQCHVNKPLPQSGPWYCMTLWENQGKGVYINFTKIRHLCVTSWSIKSFFRYNVTALPLNICWYHDRVCWDRVCRAGVPLPVLKNNQRIVLLLQQTLQPPPLGSPEHENQHCIQTCHSLQFMYTCMHMPYMTVTTLHYHTHEYYTFCLICALYFMSSAAIKNVYVCEACPSTFYSLASFPDPIPNSSMLCNSNISIILKA